MYLNISRKLAKSERGQVMTLGVLGCILVAIMMLLTLNVGQALYEKIRIQQVADSASFSLATQEARSFNFFAYTNRANLGSLVAASSTHAYATMANTVPEMHYSAGYNFLIMAAKEFRRCPGCSLFCIQHCIHGMIDMGIAANYMSVGGDLNSEMQKVDKEFKKLIDKLDGHMSDIADAQSKMKNCVCGQIRSDTILGKLNEKFAPQAGTNEGQVCQRNENQYNSCFESSKDKRKFVPTEAANGTRHKMFVSLRFQVGNDQGVLRDFIKPQTYKKWTKTIPSPATGGKSEIIAHIGEAKVIKDGSDPMGGVLKGDTGPEGDAVGSFEFGGVHSKGFCDESRLPYLVQLGSNSSNWKHESVISNGGCGEQHDNFKCLGKGECFTLFKAVKEPSKDFGQPKVYTLIKQNLRKMEGGGQGPWEVSDSGKVSMDLGGDVGKRQVQIADPHDAWALSKALVYYHWPKYDSGAGWKEHPNFFNPYWKAKLQPYRTQEAYFVLQDGGADEYTGMLTYGVPIP